jgi:hypothetical protein
MTVYILLLWQVQKSTANATKSQMLMMCLTSTAINSRHRQVIRYKQMIKSSEIHLV